MPVVFFIFCVHTLNQSLLYVYVILLHEETPNHILTLEEINSLFLTSDRDLFTGKMTIKLIYNPVIVNWYPFTLPNTGANNYQLYSHRKSAKK